MSESPDDLESRIADASKKRFLVIEIDDETHEFAISEGSDEIALVEQIGIGVWLEADGRAVLERELESEDEDEEEPD